MNVALLTAAGHSTRMGQDIPKQFMHVENKPLIIHTMEAFQKHPAIDAIMVVTLSSWEEVIKAYASQFNVTKLRWIVTGGETGQESITNGLKKLSGEISPYDAVMIHDGNRCCVSQEIISDSIAVYRQYGGAVAAIPCTEAVFESQDGKTSTVSIPRDKLFRTQTPHTFPLGKLIWAYTEVRKLGITNAVAACTVMQYLGETIHFSAGSEKNIKLTTVEDIDIFKALIHTERDKWLK